MSSSTTAVKRQESILYWCSWGFYVRNTLLERQQRQSSIA